MFSGLPFSRAFAAAYAALPFSPWTDIKVFAAQRVPVFAMCALGQLIGDASPAPDIFGGSDGLQMSGIDARRIGAKVIDVQPGGDWPVHGGVRQSVSANLNAADIHLPMAIRSFVALPLPTRLGFLYFSPKAGGQAQLAGDVQ